MPPPFELTESECINRPATVRNSSECAAVQPGFSVEAIDEAGASLNTLRSRAVFSSKRALPTLSVNRIHAWETPPGFRSTDSRVEVQGMNTRVPSNVNHIELDVVPEQAPCVSRSTMRKWGSLNGCWLVGMTRRKKIYRAGLLDSITIYFSKLILNRPKWRLFSSCE